MELSIHTHFRAEVNPRALYNIIPAWSMTPSLVHDVI